MNERALCIFGEVLFDHFPDGSRVLGGAPFNVAWHLQAFGQAPRFISRVGEDAEGGMIEQAMVDWGMDTTLLQRDAQHPTGRVSVSLVGGEPAYDIVDPCAYDAIDTAALPACNCGLLYHGSLALRHRASRDALQAVKSQGAARVFVDVNLREPWWERAVVQELVSGANWVKLNQDELALLGPAGQEDRDMAEAFVRAHDLDGLVVTHGEQGATAITRDGERQQVQPSAGQAVVDTVGAGDAFASVMILGLLRDWPLDVTLRRAQDFASRVVANRGATLSDRTVYQSLLEDWNATD